MKMIKLKDYGITPGNSKNLVKTLNDLLAALQGETEIGLVFAKGIYHFYPDFAPEKMMYISNHDEDTVKKAAFLLEHRQNLTIDGGGSNFIFHTEILPFYVAQCKNITLQNFTVDYARPTYSQGIIRAVTPQAITIEIDPEKYPWQVENNTLWFTGEGFRQTMNLWLEMDAARHAPAYQTHDFWLDGFYGVQQPTAEKSKDNTVCLHLSAKETFPPSCKVGNLLVLRHHARTHPGFYLLDSVAVTAQNIDVYNTEGIGFVAERTKDIFLRNFNVKINPHNPRIFTAAADATHFVNCYGKIELDHCLFENQMDDAVNIHGIYYKLKAAPVGDTLHVLLDHPMQKGVPIGHRGDVIAVVDCATMQQKQTFVLQECTMCSPDEFMLKANQALPTGLGPRCVLENLTAKPSALIHDCIFRNNRARGILLTCKTALVENCVFQTAGAALYMEGEAQYWFESGCTENIALKNNRFINCSYVQDWGFAPLHIKPGVQRPTKGRYYHNKVEVENNTFTCFDGRLVYARHVGELFLQNNRLEKTNAFPPIAGADIDLENFGRFESTVYLKEKA